MPVFFPTFFVSFLLAAAASLEITGIAKTFQAFQDQIDLADVQTGAEPAAPALWNCVSGTDGSGDYIGGGWGGNGICGTFADQQSIQAACEANPQCRGYTYYDGTAANYLMAPKWWCLRSSAEQRSDSHFRLCSKPGTASPTTLSPTASPTMIYYAKTTNAGDRYGCDLPGGMSANEADVAAFCTAQAACKGYYGGSGWFISTNTEPARCTQRGGGGYPYFFAKSTTAVPTASPTTASPTTASPTESPTNTRQVVCQQAVGPDLIGCDLSNRNLEAKNMTDFRLDQANLSGARLSNANLTGAYLAGANLARANLARANLARAFLFRASLAGANLTGANLTGAVLEQVIFAGVNLAGFNLTGARLAGAKLTDVDLTGVDLSGADLRGAELARAKLTRANLARADLAGANLAGVNLAGANLAGVNLAGANLAGVNLAGANLQDISVYNTDFRGAKLAGAIFGWSTFIERDCDDRICIRGFG